MASLNKSGGVTPSPKSIRLEDLSDEKPVFHPETANQLPGSGIEAPPGSGAKSVLKIAGGIVLVVGLGFLGYYVIYPVLFPAPAPAPVSQLPLANANPEPIVPATLPHQSLFRAASSVVKDIPLAQITSIDIIAGLQTEARASESAGTLKELNLSGVSGQVPFGAYLNALAPQISPAEISALLEDDFTGFLYYDSKGIWPGYVAKIRQGAPAINVESLLARLEEGDIRLFYVSDPGVHSGFKDGPYKGYRLRYAALSSPGASFNYGVVGDYIVITSSFDALKSAISYLGL